MIERKNWYVKCPLRCTWQWKFLVSQPHITRAHNNLDSRKVQIKSIRAVRSRKTTYLDLMWSMWADSLDHIRSSVSKSSWNLSPHGSPLVMEVGSGHIHVVGFLTVIVGRSMTSFMQLGFIFQALTSRIIYIMYVNSTISSQRWHMSALLSHFTSQRFDR